MRVLSRDPWTTLFGPMNQLQKEMNRLIGRWGHDGGLEWTRTAVYPALNVWEDTDALHVEAELPGLDLKDLEIYVTGGNQLTIKGERKPCMPDQGVWHRQERNFGTFIRTVALPFPVNSEKVEARLENGILLIDLAKHESAKPRKIPVTAQ